MQALSFRQQGICLSSAQVHALGRRNGLFVERFDAGTEASLDTLVEACDAALASFPGGAFVRLGACSPKDTPTAVLTGCQATSGTQVLQLLGDGSRRVFLHLRLCLRLGLPVWVFLREWAEIGPADELRCFVHDGVLAGVSQYQRHGPAPQRAAVEARRPEIAAMAATLMAAMDLRSFVFDICLGEGREALTLIELNPWGPPTDACLFAWDGGFDGSLRLI